jgi:hypothetical protein
VIRGGSLVTITTRAGIVSSAICPVNRTLPACLDLQAAARAHLKCSPILLNPPQAEALLGQFQETATYRAWLLLAVAIMTWHFHVVVGVEGDFGPECLLRDFKAYGSRMLNRQGGKPASNTWWAASGSKRKLPHEAAVTAAVDYVRHQKAPLVVWVSPAYESRGEPGT